MTQQFTGSYDFLSQLRANNSLPLQAAFHTSDNATFLSGREMSNLSQQDAYLLGVLSGGSQGDCGN